MLWMVYNSVQYRYQGGNVPPYVASEIAQSYFEALMGLQLVVVLVLTPAYVAGSIADEKSRKTLEFLLATDLRNREIVLSKLGSRLANLTIFVLTGLPILSFLQFLGGIDPNLVLAGYLGTGLTMLGLAGVSILASTYCRRSRDAIAVSYLVVFAYYAISFVVLYWQHWLPLPTGPVVWQSFFQDLWAGTLNWRNVGLDVLGRVMDAFNAGNLLFLLNQVGMSFGAGQTASILPALVRQYALFQCLLAGVCTVWSIVRLRVVAIRQMSGGRRRRWRGLRIGFRRPRVGDLPMLWKELHIEGGLRFHWVAMLITLLVMAATFVPAFAILQSHYYRGYSGYRYGMPGFDPLAAEMNGWARIMTGLVGSITLLAVAVRAATCISGERDRQTWDGLLTTPMSASQILAAKALGNVTSVRLAWLWLGGIWLLTLLAGGLHPFAIAFLVGAWIVFAFFLSMLGCWFSTVARTSTRSIVYTLLATIGLSVGHWAIWCCCMPMFFFRGPGPGRDLEYVLMFQAGITPPVALGLLTFYPYDFRDYGPHGMAQAIGFSVCGVFLWLCAALVLWTIVLQKLRLATLRGSEGHFSALDQPVHKHQPEPRQVTSRELQQPMDAIVLDEEQERRPRGARLVEEIREDPGPRGARLIEEIREQPPRRPRPEARDDE
jgi:ABC-type transport system involved in multi-copper enzyme maturation permease subunit